MKLLEGKVAIITGASRGIGKGIAEVFAAHGATVVFTYVSSDEKARALEQDLIARGGNARGFKSDAAQFDAAQQLVDEVMAAFGRVDVLVNNAGITRDTLLMRMSEEQWDEVMTVNLKSAFNLTKAVLRPMLKARSKVLLIYNDAFLQVRCLRFAALRAEHRTHRSLGLGSTGRGT